MWTPLDEMAPPRSPRPEAWPILARRRDRELICAYCSMRFDGHTREWAKREFELDDRWIERAIRRGCEVYGHDADEALREVGQPLAEEEFPGRWN